MTINTQRLTRRVGTVPAACALAAALALASRPSSAATPIPSPEKLLPDDTLAVITIPDFSVVRQIWTNSPQTRLWQDPAMKPFRDNFMARWKEELIQPLERDLGVNFDDYGDLPQGQLTLALTQDGWQGLSGHPPSILLLLDSREKKDQLKKALADLRKKWVETGKTIRTEKIRGTEFSVIALSSNDIPKTLQQMLPQPSGDDQSDSGDKPQPKGELFVGQFESLLVAGTSMAGVDKVLVHLTGGAMPSLSSLAAFEANRIALFRNAPLYGWANMKSLIDVLSLRLSEKDGDGAEGVQGPKPQDVLKATGLTGLKTVAFNVQNSSEGSSVQMFIGVPEDARQGLFKLFTGQHKESSPPPFVPADVMKFQRCRMDGQKVWATLQSVLNNINPQMLNGLNAFLEIANNAAKDKDPAFDIRKNLFGNLGDDLISYQKAPAANSPATAVSPPTIVLIASPQPQQLALAIKTVAGFLSPQPAPPDREFLGHKIYSLALPGMPVGSSDPLKSANRTLSYSAGSGYVALTTEGPMLEEYLRSSDSQQKSLRERPGLQDAAAKVGGTSTGWFGYENQTETSRILFDFLRRNAEPSSINTNTGPFGGTAGFSPSPFNIRDWMDFSLLPPFEKIAKYFYFTVYAGNVSPDGLSVKWYAPVPPSLRTK